MENRNILYAIKTNEKLTVRSLLGSSTLEVSYTKGASLKEMHNYLMHKNRLHS